MKKKKKTSTRTDRRNTEKNLLDKRNIIDPPFCLEHWFLFIITILWGTKIGYRHDILEGYYWRDCCLPHFLCKNLFTKIKLDVHLKGLWSVWDGMGADLSWGFYIGPWLVWYFFSLQFLILYLGDFPGFSLQLPPRKPGIPGKWWSWVCLNFPVGRAELCRGPLSSTKARLTLKIPPEEQPSTDPSHIHLISKPWCDIWNKKKVTTKINVSK